MFEKLLAKIARELARRRIPYMVVGGQAVLVYGEPRLTRDIDVTLGVDVSSLADIRKAASKIGLRTPVQASDRFVRDTMVLPAFDRKSEVRVDFVFSNSGYERQAISRVKKRNVGGTVVSFISVEDLIVHKLVAGRPRDLEDVRGILVRNQKLDTAYVRKWLREMDCSLGGNRSGIFTKILREIQG